MELLNCLQPLQLARHLELQVLERQNCLQLFQPVLCSQRMEKSKPSSGGTLSPVRPAAEEFAE
jgi:hypothetical protein